MSGIGRHVSSGTLEQIGVFAEQTKRVVAAHAQEAADLTSAVVMVDVQRDPGCGCALAERTHTALGLKDSAVLINRESELVPQVNFAHLFVATITVSDAPRPDSIGIRLLPCTDVRDRTGAVVSIPPLPVRK
jgi:hypothetical protein